MSSICLTNIDFLSSMYQKLINKQCFTFCRCVEHVDDGGEPPQVQLSHPGQGHQGQGENGSQNKEFRNETFLTPKINCHGLLFLHLQSQTS